MKIALRILLVTFPLACAGQSPFYGSTFERERPYTVVDALQETNKSNVSLVQVFSDDDLIALAQSGTALKSLKALIVDIESLENMPIEIATEFEIEALIFRHGPTSKDVYRKIGLMRHLEVLRIPRLKEVPLELYELANIRVLDLSGGRFKSLQWPHLKVETLILGGCKRLDFENLPDEKNSHIRNLSLASCHIKKFPCELATTLRALELLYLWRNRIRSFCPDRCDAIFDSVKTLWLAGNPIREMSVKAFDPFPNLEIVFFDALPNFRGDVDAMKVELKRRYPHVQIE